MRNRIVGLVAVSLFAVPLTVSHALAADGDGHALFDRYCATCHQLSGSGIPGAYPPLAGSPFAMGDESKVAYTVLNGRGGMPSWGPFLKDAEIAAILSYVRSSWGNEASPISAATVAKQRKISSPIEME